MIRPLRGRASAAHAVSRIVWPPRAPVWRRRSPPAIPSPGSGRLPVHFLIGLIGVLVATVASGCGAVREKHPAVGRRVGRLPLVSLADPTRAPPRLTGRVTLLNFWGTWCPPCRRELPTLVRLAERLADKPGFQLVAVSCGGGGPDDLEELTGDTRRFLESQKLAIEAWGDPDGFTRMAFTDAYGFNAFPTTYLVGPDATIRRVWTGYRAGDEADMATAVLGLLKDLPAAEPAEGPTVPVALSTAGSGG
jgi:cytochrome c biogenesis protein CcmG/thiol:disulfide interchange protein DsbE